MSAAAFGTFFDNRAQCYAGNTNAQKPAVLGDLEANLEPIARRAVCRDAVTAE
jgi:hypothetical protein